MVLAHPNFMRALIRPVCVSRLRITGFMSFADPVALDILPGLIGPNGCGKSNVVDRRVAPVGRLVLRIKRGR